MNRYSYFIRTLEKVDLFPCFIFLQNFFLPFNANITLVEMKPTILGYFFVIFITSITSGTRYKEILDYKYSILLYIYNSIYHDKHRQILF